MMTDTTSQIMVSALKTYAQESTFFHSFWELKNLGILNATDRERSLSPIMNFDGTINIPDKSYVMVLPWKEGVELSNNRHESYNNKTSMLLSQLSSKSS